MRCRTFRYYFDDTLNGVYSYRGDAMINKKPITMNMAISPAKQKLNGQKATAARLAKSFLKRLEHHGKI